MTGCKIGNWSGTQASARAPPRCVHGHTHHRHWWGGWEPGSAMVGQLIELFGSLKTATSSTQKFMQPTKKTVKKAKDSLVWWNYSAITCVIFWIRINYERWIIQKRNDIYFVKCVIHGIPQDHYVFLRRWYNRVNAGHLSYNMSEPSYC